MAKPLTMYDASTDLIRPVTQEDINLMQRRLNELARFRDQVRVTVTAQRVAEILAQGERQNG
jgi:hypothetical protein